MKVLNGGHRGANSLRLCGARISSDTPSHVRNSLTGERATAHTWRITSGSERHDHRVVPFGIPCNAPLAPLNLADKCPFGTRQCRTDLASGFDRGDVKRSAASHRTARDFADNQATDAFEKVGAIQNPDFQSCPAIGGR